VDDLRESLPGHQPRFVVYSYRMEHADGRVSYPMCFIYITPRGRKLLFQALSMLEFVYKFPYIFLISDWNVNANSVLKIIQLSLNYDYDMKVGKLVQLIALYIMFNLSASSVLQCVLHSHHPLLFGIYHCMQVTASVLCAHHTCSISDIIVVIPLCRIHNSQ